MKSYLSFNDQPARPTQAQILARHHRIKHEHAAMLEALRECADAGIIAKGGHSSGMAMLLDTSDKARAVLATIDGKQS